MNSDLRKNITIGTRLPNALLLLMTAALPLLAQSGVLDGTWSGDWKTDSEYLRRVTVEFHVDGESVTGRMINPEPVEFSDVSFDGDSGDLVAEADAENYRIVATVDGTRLDGTLVHDGTRGDLTLTKWTFVPRSR